MKFLFKNILFLYFFSFFLLLNSCFLIKNKNEDVKSIEKILSKIQDIQFSKTSNLYGYQSSYLLLIKQPIDHNNPELGYFKQRVWVSHLDFDRPVVIITEGYNNNYNYLSEIAEFLKANQIIVEHRYFGNSLPDSIDWTFLNLFQQSSDLHHIKNLLSNIYPNVPWISSGISKGGQTSIAYRYFFPDDVSASVAYVAPHTFAREDLRINDFLKNKVGDSICRNKIYNFQKQCLINRDTIIQYLNSFCQINKLTFKAVGSLDIAYEFGILEFSFAFWQWGYTCFDIPQDVLNMDSTLAVLFDVNPFEFFSDKFIKDFSPYFYQGLTEMGVYTYETAVFGDLLKYVKNPTFDFTMENKIITNYNNKLNLDINNWLQTEGNNFIYIYGEYDPWGACAVEVDNLKVNSLKLVKEKGSHTTRIKSFDFDVKMQIIDSLEKWTNFKISTN